MNNEKKNFDHLNKYLDGYGTDEKPLNEASSTYNVLSKEYPKASKMVGKVSQALEWDIEGAFSFCLHLLEDVNAHDEVKDLEKFFTKQMNKF